MRFRNGKLRGPPINLARACEHDLDARVTSPAGLEDGKLGLAIDLEIRHGIEHGIQMARLPGKVKEIILPLDEVLHAVTVANVGHVDLDAVPDSFDIIKVPAVIPDQAIDDGDLRAETDKSPRKIRSYKAEASGDE